MPATNITFGWSDILLVRDAANTPGIRNGTNFQTVNIYGTFTDDSNYERLALRVQNATDVLIAAQTAGSGTNDIGITITPGGAGNLTLSGGQYLVPDGSFAAPSIRRSGDNRGFWFQPTPAISSPNGFWIYHTATLIPAILGINSSVAMQVGAGYQFVWTSGAEANAGSADTGLKRAVAAVVQPTDGSTGNGALYSVSGTPLRVSDGANGKFLNVQSNTELTTVAAAATTDTTITFPTNSLGIGVSIRVVSAFSGTASVINLGVAGATT